MNITGIVSVSTGNRTLIVGMGKSQIFPIPQGFHDIAITPELEEKGVKIDGANLFIPGPTALIMNLSPRFGRLELATLTKEDAESFSQAMRSDPDVAAFAKQMMVTAKRGIDRTISDLSKVLDLISEDGPTAEIIKQIEAADWSGAIIEVAKAVKIAFPELWASIEKNLPPEDLVSFSDLIK